MKVILASIACNIIEKTKDIFGKPFKEIQITVIPTVANTYAVDNRPWFDKELNVFKKLGFNIKILEIENKNKEEIKEGLKNTEAIFVTGGNTYYLLYHAKKSGLFSLIKEMVSTGVIYIGSSAGSILAGLNVDIARRFDDSSIVDLKNYEGLAFTQSLILPHFDKKENTEELKETVKEWEHKGYKITSLRNDQALIIDENSEYII
mgnify:FL=1